VYEGGDASSTATVSVVSGTINIDGFWVGDGPYKYLRGGN
jgi:hypothetical protein